MVDTKNMPLSADDWVLALLYANNRKPLHGKLMLVKQMFLVTKEMVPTLDDELQFFAYDLGPYSKVLAERVDALVQEGLISVEGSGGDFTFQLTPEGEQKAQRAMANLTDELKSLLERKRLGWDQLGYRGIVRLVYTRYPQYAGRSKIIEMVE
jgi:uncharacterized protein YwgA